MVSIAHTVSRERAARAGGRRLQLLRDRTGCAGTRTWKKHALDHGENAALGERDEGHGRHVVRLQIARRRIQQRDRQPDRDPGWFAPRARELQANSA